MQDSNIGITAHALLIVGLLGMTGCETIESMTKSKLPTVKASDAKIAAANFSAIDFLIDLEVQNPNAFGLSLSGFDYDLQINDDSFLTGTKTDALRLEANQSSTIAIPMSLPLQDLATKIPDILKQDTFDYAFAAQLQFNMPLVGMINVPIRKIGTLPVIRPPRIKDLKLAKKGINLTGADLELNLNIENPNNFDLQMKQF
jgi:LEA14-like dessication related protein